MKKIQVCRVCGRPVSKGNAYHAEVEKEIQNPVTGEVKYEVVVGPICPPCTAECGYSVKKEKLEKYQTDES